MEMYKNPNKDNSIFVSVTRYFPDIFLISVNKISFIVKYT